MNVIIVILCASALLLPSRAFSQERFVVAVSLVPWLTSGEALASVLGQSAAASSSRSSSEQNAPDASLAASGVDILSDTRGVDFSPYLKTILPAIRVRWMVLLPEKTHPPTSAKGETDIRFTILPDGTLAPGTMHLDGGTHDFAIDRAAWGAIISSKFAPLPANFTGPSLELRVRFRVNLGADERIPSAAPQPSDGKAGPAPAD
jgi:hypothetical protein